ncbi:hypothetical protein [Sphingomonas sp. PB4P5]|uniref:hypothetical protein n=1 Tax=Parasphingomonas puruogangriensis TaxID=3096155 RepID=UPI002FC726DB
MFFRISPWRPAVLLPLALTACASPESRTRDALIKAGLSHDVAECMADQLVDNLSIAQLRRLSALGKAEKKGVKHLLRRIRDLHDPQIVSVTATAAATCAIGLPG